MKITIIGAGSTGYALAADLSTAGLDVTLYEEPEYAFRLAAARERGGVEFVRPEGRGFAGIKNATTDVEEALDGADLIIVAVVAGRHERIALLCSPHLKGNQMIIISQGGAGSLIFSRVLGGRPEGLIISELEGNFYSCRLAGPTVEIALVPGRRHIAAFPAANTAMAISRCKDIFTFEPAANVLETALNSPNLVVHLAGSLLNTGAIENAKGAFYLFGQGLSPSVLRCMRAIYEEKLALFEKLSYRDRFNWNFLERIMNPGEYPEYDKFRLLDGPNDMNHRYVTEDASTGLVLLSSLGELLGVSTPVSRALVQLASAIKGVDYFKRGRNVHNLGIGGLCSDELNAYLQTGG